jgi:hypothetical protein
MKYELKIDLTRDDFYIRDIADMLDMLRESAAAEITNTLEGVPVEVTVTYDVGPGEVAEDLWELRDVVGDQESKMPCRMSLGKPTPKEETQ